MALNKTYTVLYKEHYVMQNYLYTIIC